LTWLAAPIAYSISVAVGANETIAVGREVKCSFPAAVEIVTGKPCAEPDPADVAAEPVPEELFADVLLHAALTAASAATAAMAGSLRVKARMIILRR